MNIIAETERLTIRWLASADIEAVAPLWTDERVTRFMGGPRSFDRVSASLRKALNLPPLKLDLWAVVERRSGAVVGDCGLLPKTVDGRDEVELVYVIAADCWGKGFATEAASAIRNYPWNSLALERQIALIDPANQASERVAKKLGMKFESETVRPGGRSMKVYAIGR